jgi:large subunit ribosomal protein L29
MKGTPFKDVSGLGKAELEGKLDDLYKELFNLRFQRAQGQLTDTTSIKTVRHNIAKVKTAMRQIELRAEMAAKKSKESGS